MALLATLSAEVFAYREKGVPMALASRTPTPDVARAFLKKLGEHLL